MCNSIKEKILFRIYGHGMVWYGMVWTFSAFDFLLGMKKETPRCTGMGSCEEQEGRSDSDQFFSSSLT